MTAAPVPLGRVLLVELSPAELTLLQGEFSDEPAVEALHVTELPDRLGGQATASAGPASRRPKSDPPVDLVVLGSQVGSPLPWVQRVHRLAPDAAIAVLSNDPAPVRRQAGYAPAVPLDLLVTAPDAPGLAAQLRELRQACAERRRHTAVLAAVLRRSDTDPHRDRAGLTAVGSLLEHAPIAALVTTTTGQLLGWNRRAEELLRLGPPAAGRPVGELMPEAVPVVAEAARTALATGTTRSTDAAGTPGGRVQIGSRVVELTGAASQTDDGQAVVLLFATDVTAQRELEQQRDRLAEHVQLLGQVSESLTGRLDNAEPLSRLAQTLVPALADWVSVQVREDGQLRNVSMRHRQPELARITREAEALKDVRGVSTEPSRRAAGGEVLLLPHVRAGDLDAMVPDPQLRSLVQQLGIGSALAVPIPGRSDVLGSVLLVRASGRTGFAEAERDLAVEIGRRAGVALDNARLYAGQRELATELQQSLLTDPPALPFADLAVRYVAAGREAQVGGDWYDAFRRRNGDVVLTIGDVVGHDSRAAAAMGQIRGITRGIAFSTTDEPSQVLTAVDEAIEGLELATIATALIAQLTPAAPGSDGAATLRWSNAGHPAPVLISPDGSARLLEPTTGKADLLLGIAPATRRTTQHIALSPGSTVLLYTDGLVERRGESLDDGWDRLLHTVQHHTQQSADSGTGGSAEALCDAVLTALAPQAGDDDIALVALRLH